MTKHDIIYEATNGDSCLTAAILRASSIKDDDYLEILEALNLQVSKDHQVKDKHIKQPNNSKNLIAFNWEG